MKDTIKTHLQKVEQEVTVDLYLTRAKLSSILILLTKSGEASSEAYSYFSRLHQALNGLLNNMPKESPITFNPALVETESTESFLEKNSFEDPFAKTNPAVKAELKLRTKV